MSNKARDNNNNINNNNINNNKINTIKKNITNQELLCNKYIILKKLGSGSFGEVYLAETNNNNIKLQVAAKVEERKKSSRLEQEFNAYTYLHKKNFTSQSGLPEVYDFIQTQDYNILYMQLLGDSLEDLYNKRKKFSMSTCLKLSVQLIDLLENVHTRKIIHRDIKPSNFLIDIKNKSQLYIMDFGLSKKFINNNKHINFTDKRSLIGTARYASKNMHLGSEPSRRDDLESVGYMLIYFLKGSLPWQGLKKIKTSNKIATIGEVKIATQLNKLCESLPGCFLDYLKYTQSLKFEEEPNYKYLKKLFLDYSRESNTKLIYDWE